MLFSSITFLFFFLPAFLLLYFASRRVTWRNLLLLAASLLFYAWGEPRFVLVMLLSIVITHGLGVLIGSAKDGRRRVWLGLGVTLNLLILAIFKYADFLIGNVNSLLATAGIEPLPLPGLPLPLGISFFIFQAVSYLVDVYRREAPPARSLAEVALYISMFPQLVAGPIVRYRTIAFHLRSRQVTWARAGYGFKLFIIGLAQKVLIADQVAPIADAAFGSATDGALSPMSAWIGTLAYSAQIYFDFGGYSNMAIGLGLVLGFGFMRNFRFPYTAKSVSEFWRRWHISLSTWFRDYLYIPLGGNRGGALKTGRNLLVVFLLCGIWHGASWNFVIWGLHHGVFLIIERTAFGRWMSRQAGVVRSLYTLLVVMTGWVWFRAETLPEALSFFAAMVGFNVGSTSDLPLLHAATPLAIGALALGIVLAFNGGARLLGWTKLSGSASIFAARAPALGRLSLVAMLVFACGFVASGSFSPFLYFRF